MTQLTENDTVDKGSRVTGADIYSALECRLELSLVMLC